MSGYSGGALGKRGPPDCGGGSVGLIYGKFGLV